VPWLEPDVNDHLRALAKGEVAGGAPTAVVLVPVGFVHDHMEVVHDLDIEAAQTAAALGLPFARAKAPGGTPEFAAMVAELVAELTAGAPARALGDFGARAYVPLTGNGGTTTSLGCPVDCCRYTPARPPVQQVPTAQEPRP
jgi:ferrochelatase